jgi:branched-chain amino acid transport system substrate-binding protein
MKQFASTTTLAAIVLAAAVTTAPAQETIKVGVIQPLTGAFAASGNYVANGAKIAADEINAKGGVLGKKLELVIEDNKSNPTEAAAVAEKLIVRDKVPVMMGAWGSGFTLAIMPKLMEYKVPMLVETSSAGKITTSGNPYIFRISPPSAVEAVSFAKLVDKYGRVEVLWFPFTTVPWIKMWSVAPSKPEDEETDRSLRIRGMIRFRWWEIVRFGGPYRTRT